MSPRKLRTNFNFIGGFAAATSLALLAWASGCQNFNPQQTAKTVHDAVILADDACVVLRDVDPNGAKTEEICVKADEIRKLLPVFAAARRDAGHD